MRPTISRSCSGAVCFTGDAVLAQSSVFVAPDPGAMRGYLAALAAPARDGPRAAVHRPRPAGHRSRGAARPLPRPPRRPRAAARRRARRRSAHGRRAAGARLGRRARRACGWPRRRRSPRTSTSSARRGGCPTACSARRGRRRAACGRSSDRGGRHPASGLQGPARASGGLGEARAREAIAAVSGVTQRACASSKIRRSVSPIPRTRLPARRGVVAAAARARRRC